MSSKPTDTRPGRKLPKDAEDTAMLSLSRADRKKLAMDSWEPTMLRKLLKAQNRLKQRG
jgi:hypothetical protein